ncbi:MAG: NINE protein [Prevotellaceae bacterium]|nr:NINE protein [Prevotellaceae bacterium]
MAEIKCPACGSPNVEQIGTNKYQCPYCGKTFSPEVAPAPQPQPQPQQQYAPQQPAAPAQPQYAPQQPAAPTTTKSKVTAGLLAILLGGLGAHHFYLGHIGKGILYLLFCWTYIPSIAGLIEGIIYLTESEADFAKKHAS